MHHRWKIAWSCALQEWRQLASHSRNLKNCPQVPAQRWTVSVLIYPVNCKEKKNPQNQKYFVPRGKNFTLYIGGLIAWDPTDPSVHTSQSGEWKIMTAPGMENFDGLALQGSHTIYITLYLTLYLIPHLSRVLTRGEFLRGGWSSSILTGFERSNTSAGERGLTRWSCHIKIWFSNSFQVVRAIVVRWVLTSEA